MSDKTPASLTSSLLARKGSAAPAAETLGEPEGADETVSHADGAPDDPDSHDSFLTRGPDPVVPDPVPEPSPLGGALDEDGAEPSRPRRAPLIILAILLVFVLAGAGWFAASVFLRGGEEGAVASTRMPPAARSPTHATTGLQPVVSQTPAPMPAPPASPAGGGNQEPVTALLSPVPPVKATEPAGSDASPPPVMSEAAALPTVGAADEATAGSPPAEAMAEPQAPRSVAIAKKESAPPVPAPASEPAPPAAKRAQPQEKAEPAKPAMAAAKPAEPPPPAKPVRVAARPAGTHGVQLASVSTRAQADRALKQLSRKFASILDGTALRVQTATLRKHGTVYRIQTPAVLSVAGAKSLCSRLKSARQPCFVFSR